MVFGQVLEEHAAQCEHVTSVAHYTFGHFDFTLIQQMEDFRCQVVPGTKLTADGEHSLLAALTAAEIGDFQLNCLLRSAVLWNEDVARFDVPVNQIHRVDVVHSGGNLR